MSGDETELSREELIRLVDRICAADGSEEEIDALLETLCRNVVHPAVSDLIFHSLRKMTSEEIVGAALSYQPIAS